jgi:hypothetical protein
MAKGNAPLIAVRIINQTKVVADLTFGIPMNGSEKSNIKDTKA